MPRKLLPIIEVIPARTVRVEIEVRQPTDNPKLEAWYAVRQEWIANDGRVTPELRRLEYVARKAIDSRAIAD